MIFARPPENRHILSMLPSYFGTNGTEYDVRIMGIGVDSLLSIENSIHIRDYGQALTSDTLSLVRSPETSRRARLSTYSEIVRELESLNDNPERDDLGRVRPSQNAIDHAREVVFRMAEAGVSLPVPEDISTDRDGAIRILWDDGDRTIELICPFDARERAYVYYGDRAQYRIAFDLSVSRLARLLSWLIGATAEFPR